MARLTSNSINLKPIRKCKCHKRSFSDGFARTDSVLGLISWYRDNVIGVQPFLEISPITHNLNQTTITNPVVAHAICSAGQTSVPPTTTTCTVAAHAICSVGQTSVPPATRTKTECVPYDYGSHRALIGESNITLTAKALKSAQAEAYPTEAAEKKRDAKRAAKAAGKEVKVKKRPKNIQDHFDDCGTSLDGLGVDLEKAYYEESDRSLSFATPHGMHQRRGLPSG